MPHSCPTCGALYPTPNDNCSARFDALLALDHSRTEPWGSRHALAFSVFALHHPDRFDHKVLHRSWSLLCAVVDNGHNLQRTTAAFRRLGNREPDWDLPPLPNTPPPPPFPITIADLGTFDAATYPELLNQWCRATLTHWRSSR